MSDRTEIAKTFYIDDHAALYGMLARAAEQLYGEEGERGSIHATKLYAAERGKRMKRRAEEDHMPLTLETYRIYTEWEDRNKRMKVETIRMAPDYRMNGIYCVWNETWKQYQLEKYGCIYCSIVDQTMVKSFNPENELVIHSTLSQGGKGCDFEWIGLHYADERELQEAFQKKQALQQRAVKDFLYHCGHVLSAMKRGYGEFWGTEAAEKILSCGTKDYSLYFGEEKKTAILKEAALDFQAV